jgi:hypothetical protein
MENRIGKSIEKTNGRIRKTRIEKSGGSVDERSA